MKRKKISICSLAMSAAILAGCSNPNTSVTQETTAQVTASDPQTTTPVTAPITHATQSVDPTDPITRATQPVDPTAPTATTPITKAPISPDALQNEYYRFTLDILKRSLESSSENVMVSPLSLMLALSMTANGAGGNTAQEMLSVLGGDMTMEQLNEVLHAYVKDLPSDREAQLKIANSIWCKDDPDLSIRESFLNVAKEYYSAGIFPAAFDEATLEAINNWVNTNTDGMIKKLLDRFDPNTQMILINAILFDGKWQEEYYEGATQKLPFTNNKGEMKKVEQMFSEENIYLTGKNYTGFAKYYKGENYAFVGLLPNEGTTPEELIAGMNAQGLKELWTNAKKRSVYVRIPKFTFDYSNKMNDILRSMGMESAFDPVNADFSGMTEKEKLHISSVLHKTRVEVTEKGTRAAAVTSISMANEAVIEVDPTPEVFLDRPFVFMIVDTEQALPIFMGRVNDLEGEEIPASAGGQQSQVPTNPATQANGTYADSFKCGYLGDNPMKPGYLYLVSTEEEAEYVRKHMDSPANIGVIKLMKFYPLSDYSYLLLYTEYGSGGYYMHADSIECVDGRIGFHYDFVDTPGEVATAVMDGDFHYGAFPKDMIRDVKYTTTTSPIPADTQELSGIYEEELILEILTGSLFPAEVEFGFGGEAGYSCTSSTDEKIIRGVIDALNAVEVVREVPEDEPVSYVADGGVDIMFYTTDRRKVTLNFDGDVHVILGDTLYEIANTHQLSEAISVMQYVPFLAQIEDGYIAVLHGGVGERTYETYVYENGKGYKFYNVISTTESWGSSKRNLQVRNYGTVDTKEDVFRRAKEHGADQFVTYPGDPTAYPVEEFYGKKE